MRRGVREHKVMVFAESATNEAVWPTFKNFQSHVYGDAKRGEARMISKPRSKSPDWAIRPGLIELSRRTHRLRGVPPPSGDMYRSRTRG